MPKPMPNPQRYTPTLKQKDFVPILYSTETSWASELLKFAPTLLIIGVWLFVMRQMGGGMGGGAGGGKGSL
jgi:AFG3 family protein